MDGRYPRTVSLESWNYVHVEMKNLLLGFFSCKEEVDSVASQTRLADGVCYAQSDLEKIHARSLLDTR